MLIMSLAILPEEKIFLKFWRANFVPWKPNNILRE